MRRDSGWDLHFKIESLDSRIFREEKNRTLKGRGRYARELKYMNGDETRGWTELIFEYQVLTDGEWQAPNGDNTTTTGNHDHLCRYLHLKSGNENDSFDALTGKFHTYKNTQDWKVCIIQGRDPYGWEYSTAKDGPYRAFQETPATIRRRKWQAVFTHRWQQVENSRENILISKFRMRTSCIFDITVAKATACMNFYKRF